MAPVHGVDRTQPKQFLEQARSTHLSMQIHASISISLHTLETIHPYTKLKCLTHAMSHLPTRSSYNVLEQVTMINPHDSRKRRGRECVCMHANATHAPPTRSACVVFRDRSLKSATPNAALMGTTKPVKMRSNASMKPFLVRGTAGSPRGGGRGALYYLKPWKRFRCKYDVT